MKAVSVEEFRAHVDEYLADAARGEVVLTSGGKPWLVLRAIGDEEAVPSNEFAHSPEFWQMIRQRRQETGTPWGEARKELELHPD